jgi:hypothetical protein
MMPLGAFRALRQFFAKLFRQFRRVSELTVVNIDVFCDNGFYPPADSVRRFRFLDPNRLEQVEYMARLYLAN